MNTPRKAYAWIEPTAFSISQAEFFQTAKGGELWFARCDREDRQFYMYIVSVAATRHVTGWHAPTLEQLKYRIVGKPAWPFTLGGREDTRWQYSLLDASEFRPLLLTHSTLTWMEPAVPFPDVQSPEDFKGWLVRDEAGDYGVVVQISSRQYEASPDPEAVLWAYWGATPAEAIERFHELTPETARPESQKGALLYMTLDAVTPIEYVGELPFEMQKQAWIEPVPPTPTEGIIGHAENDEEDEARSDGPTWVLMEVRRSAVQGVPVSFRVSWGGTSGKVFGFFSTDNFQSAVEYFIFYQERQSLYIIQDPRQHTEFTR